MDNSTIKALYGGQALLGILLIVYSMVLSNLQYVLDSKVSTSVLANAADVVRINLVGSGSIGLAVFLVGVGFLVNAVAGYYSVE